MLGWVARFLLFFAGIITGLFLSHEDINFPLMQMAVAMFLMILLLAAAAFWPSLRACFKRGPSQQSDK
jgi:hypothetical protein